MVYVCLKLWMVLESPNNKNTELSQLNEINKSKARLVQILKAEKWKQDT